MLHQIPFQVGNVPVQTYKAISCKKLSLPFLEDENIYSQSLGWNLVNDSFLIKLFIILVDLNIQTS